MCLKENYSPSNEYSHLLGRVCILRRRDMNSKSGEEQKKGHHVRISTQNRVQSKKKGRNDNALMLGRVSINTRTRLGTSLLALPQVKIMHYIGLSMQRKIALYVSFFKLCYYNYTAVNLKTGRFDNINSAVIISNVCKAVQNCKN